MGVGVSFDTSNAWKCSTYPSAVKTSRTNKHNHVNVLSARYQQSPVLNLEQQYSQLNSKIHVSESTWSSIKYMLSVTCCVCGLALVLDGDKI